MKINCANLYIKEIYYNNKRFQVETCNKQELKTQLESFSKNEIILLDREGTTWFLDKYMPLNGGREKKLSCVTNDNEEITLFDVCIYRKMEDEKYIIILTFNKIVYGVVDSTTEDFNTIRCNKLKVQLTPSMNIESFCNCDIGEYEVSICKNESIQQNIRIQIGETIERKEHLNRINNCFFIKVSGDINTLTFNEMYSHALNFYEYLSILYGYFPIIESLYYYINNQEYKCLFEMPGKYITHSERFKYKINNSFFIQKLDKRGFFESYDKFLELKKSKSTILNLYYYSTMESIVYIDFSIIYQLHVLDGLFISQKGSTYQNDKGEERKHIFEYKIRDMLKQINRSTGLFKKEKSKYINNQKYINSLFGNKYKKESNYFDCLMIKFRNTRDRYAHGLEKREEECLFSEENFIYNLKLDLSCRLHILKEIQVSYNEEEIKKFINNYDKNISQLFEGIFDKYNQIS